MKIILIGLNTKVTSKHSRKSPRMSSYTTSGARVECKRRQTAFIHLYKPGDPTLFRKNEQHVKLEWLSRTVLPTRTVLSSSCRRFKPPAVVLIILGAGMSSSIWTLKQTQKCWNLVEFGRMCNRRQHR